MTCGRYSKQGLAAPLRRFAALVPAFAWMLLASPVDLRAQNSGDVPPPAAASAPDTSPGVEVLRTGPDLAAATALQPFGDPALVYVPPTAEGILTAELAAFGDDPALYPLYRGFLQTLLSFAPVPADRLEDLEGFTMFVVPYSPAEANGVLAADPVATPDSYLAQASAESTQYGFGWALRFRKPFYDRDLRQVLGPEPERIGSALIPTYRVGGSTVRLLENRYLVLLQNEVSPGVIPFLNPGSFARTPTGRRISALQGPTLRARALISGSLLRQIESSGLTLDDQALFRTFWGERVEAWTLRFDSVTVQETTRFVFETMIVTDSETVATRLEEDLVGVVRLALAAARDQTASEEASDAVDRSVLDSNAASASAAKLLVNSIDERRLSVGHIGPAAGVRLVMLPEEIEALPSMLEGILFAAPDIDALEQDRARQRLVLRAMRAYYDANGHVPPPVVFDAKSGQPRSWRVELLPFLAEKELFSQYRTDEPWDSPHNRELIARIPDVYRSSFDLANPPGLALAALVHPDGVFSPAGKVRGADIADGGAKTMGIATVRLPIPWTRPQDIDALGTEVLADLAWTGEGVLAGFADGRVHLLRDIDPELLRRLIDRNDGQPTEAIKDLPGIELDPEPDPVPERSMPASDAEGVPLPEAEIAPPLLPAGQLPPQKNPFADGLAPSSVESIPPASQP
ncbi:MAG TPA: DUF1559 domain-containing protein [Pirellulaceae bacterium]|jgi:hypothetical protein|nr:DUF1559 domain-containing protein [Pirellulaceae bacterium]